MSGAEISVARLIADINAFNAIMVQKADIYIQKYPGPPNVNAGVEKLDYTVETNGRVTQSGKSGANGKIEVRVLIGSKTVLKVMGTEYEVSISGAAFAPVANHLGRKERLRYLGYQIGHYGPNKNGVDNNSTPRFEYERSVCDFQADKGNTHDANPASVADGTASTIDGDLANDAGA